MIKTYIAFSKGSDLEHVDINESFFKVSNVGYAFLYDIEQFITKPQNSYGVYLFIYIKQGHLHVKSETGNYSLSTGQACILYPNMTYTYTFPKENLNEHYYVYFGGYGTNQILKELKLDMSPIIYSSDHSSFSEKFIRMYNNFKINKFKYPTINTSLLLQILTNISISSNKIPLQAQDTKILPAIQKMQNDYMEILSLDDYAKLCNMSKSNFIKLFKEEKRISPQKYIANIRLNIAKELLNTTNLSISEIAQNIGFDDAYYFSNFFKKATGLSPLNYKKKHFNKRK